MATIETGSIVSDIRGSVGNEVYSRGPGGLYVKNRTSPSQPASEYRDASQATMTHLSQYWSGALTEAQRQTWRQYAQVWKIPNRLGQQISIQAHCHFIRCNFYPYLIETTVPFLSAPAGGPTAMPGFVFSASGGGNTVTISLPPTNYDPLPGGLNLYLSVGQQVSCGVNYYSSPWRYSGWNHWNGSTWTHDPWTVSTPWPLSSGSKLFCRMIAALDEGETSGPYPCSTLIT